MKELFFFEWKKLFSKRIAQIGFVLVFLFNVSLTVSSYQSLACYDYQTDQSVSGIAAIKMNHEIAARYGGVLDDAKVQQMLTDFKPSAESLSRFQGISLSYVYINDMQSAVHSFFADNQGNWNGVSVGEAFPGQEIQVGYTSGWLNLSRNLIRVSLAVAIFMVLVTAPVFAGEYHQMDSLILSSRYGKTKCITAKILAVLSASLVVPFCFIVLNGITALCIIGTQGLNASILFTGKTEAIMMPIHLTCGELLLYQIVFSFTGILAAVSLTLLASAFCKSPIAALACGAILFLFPMMMPLEETNPLYPLYVLLPVYHIQSYSLISTNPFWALPVSIALAILCGIGAKILFANHEAIS